MDRGKGLGLVFEKAEKYMSLEVGNGCFQVLMKPWKEELGPSGEI